jgi:aldose sugar dehydrogenase
MTIGDRGDKNFEDHPSQDPSNHLGTTVRLEPDGSVPEDNPFVDDDEVADEIYSYGHRNAQGMAVHPDTGELWQSEHGEQDGDEINIVEGGGNYGWPVATTGCEYGTDIPVGVHPDEYPDGVAPVHYWECGTGGFAPGGMAFYVGDEFPEWQGDLLLAGLEPEYLARFTVDGTSLQEAEPLLEGHGRIRDVAVSPIDGAIYVAIDDDNVPLVRIVDGA